MFYCPVVPRSVCLRWLILLLLLCTSVCRIGIAEETLSTKYVDDRGAQIASQSGVTGMVLVVVREHGTEFYSYGETFPGSGLRPQPQSVVRLCSLTKIFTTDLLDRLMLNGTIRLTDTLQQFAPVGVKIPLDTLHGPAARGIMLGDLATHTSGLVREVGAYPRLTAHFTFPSYDYRWQWLPHQRLRTSPGTVALYSNVAFDFLGDAISKAVGKPYEELLRDWITVPLGMHDTTLAPSENQCERLLRGTDDQGPCTDTRASAGSGGLYSTSADMTRFLQSVLHLPGIPPQPASYLAVYVDPSQLTSMQGLDHAGRPSGIGLGWLRLGDMGSPSMIMEKTGGGAGFTTYIALNLQRHIAIFAAATNGNRSSHGNFFEMINDLLAAVAVVPPLPASMYPVHAASTVKRMAKNPRPSKGPRVRRKNNQ
jgi:D-alanyl-D-alanine-carboxypeptidase/D-alanyl-D-alanine-endopeptidase